MRTLEPQGYRARPLGLSEARQIMRGKFSSGECWLLVVHSNAGHLLIAIEQRYYLDHPEDFTLLTHSDMETRQTFAIVAAAKKRMSASQYSDLLREIAGIELQPANQLQAIAHPHLVPEAMALAYAILGDGIGDDLAMAS